MTVLEFMISTFDNKDEYAVRNAIKCVDGFSVSIQGGTKYHYCSPRTHCDCYELLELGYPSELDDSIKEYAELPCTTQTVFGYVPLEVVEKLIKKHGGIK